MDIYSSMAMTRLWSFMMRNNMIILYAVWKTLDLWAVSTFPNVIPRLFSTHIHTVTSYKCEEKTVTICFSAIKTANTQKVVPLSTKQQKAALFQQHSNESESEQIHYQHHCVYTMNKSRWFHRDFNCRLNHSLTFVDELLCSLIYVKIWVDLRTTTDIGCLNVSNYKYI